NSVVRVLGSQDSAKRRAAFAVMQGVVWRGPGRRAIVPFYHERPATQARLYPKTANCRTRGRSAAGGRRSAMTITSDPRLYVLDVPSTPKALYSPSPGSHASAPWVIVRNQLLPRRGRITVCRF